MIPPTIIDDTPPPVTYGPVPRAIHRWSDGAPDPLGDWTGQALQLLHPGWQVADWTDDSLPADVVAGSRTHLGRVPLDGHPVHRANIIRYHLLHRYGGWWLDRDIVLFQPLPNISGPTSGYMRGGREQSLLGFPAGHPLLAELIDEATNGTASGSAFNVSGTALFRRLAEHHDLGRFEGIYPVDAAGNSTRIDRPTGLHLWSSSHRGAH